MNNSVSKKGITTVMMILEIIIILVSAALIFSLASKFASSETTNKILIADDIKMMVDTLVGTPGEALVQYPSNVSKYTFILSSSSITVFIKGEGEQKKIVRYFSLPEGYQAFGTLENRDALCLAKEKKKIVLRECLPAKEEESVAEQALPELLPGEPNFYGIPITGDRIVFVIDRSFSMEEHSEWEFSGFEAPEDRAGNRFEVAVWQFTKALQELPDGKYFAIILFNDKITDETVFSAKFAEVNGENREKARLYVKDLKPVGLTNLFEPLKLALSYENVDTIFLITDGFPSQGLTDHDKLLGEVQKLNVHGAKINTIGTFTLGAEGTTALQEKEKGEKLLKALAEQNGGAFVMREK